METFLSIYLIIGLINALVIWWATFDTDYDQFIRDNYREEPPTTNQKIIAIITGVFIWPVHLYWVVKQ